MRAVMPFIRFNRQRVVVVAASNATLTKVVFAAKVPTKQSLFVFVPKLVVMLAK
jgi:hypothetical protein